MENILGGMIAPVLLIMGLIYVPIMNLSIQADQAGTRVVDNAIQAFVDNARSSGRIEADEYEKMIQTVHAVHPLCDVTLTYGKECFEVQGESFLRYHEEIGTDGIMDVIYTETGENRPFLMDVGDTLRVVVQNTTPTLGMKILSLFLPKAQSVKTICSSYGGFIENTGAI